jgi:hypothetical protein
LFAKKKKQLKALPGSQVRLAARRTTYREVLRLVLYATML